MSGSSPEISQNQEHGWVGEGCLSELKERANLPSSSFCSIQALNGFDDGKDNYFTQQTDSNAHLAGTFRNHAYSGYPMAHSS